MVTLALQYTSLSGLLHLHSSPKDCKGTTFTSSLQVSTTAALSNRFCRTIPLTHVLQRSLPSPLTTRVQTDGQRNLETAEGEDDRLRLDADAMSAMAEVAAYQQDGGIRNWTPLMTRPHLVHASSQTPVQRRLITFLALTGASFSILPLDLLSGQSVMASASSSETATNEDSLLYFAKGDNRRMLHAVYRVGDLDKTVKFYTECLGMKLLRRRDIPEEKYSNAFLGYGPEDTNFAVELTYNYGVDKYDIGTGFGHFGIAVEDVQKVVDLVKAKGGKVSREPGPVKGGKSIIAFIEDPDGYNFELIQRPSTPEPFCQIMLRVGDLDRAVQFYEKAFGMKELRRQDNPDQKYTLATVGYGDDELKTTVLELTYNYGVTEYTKGDAYGQIAVGTNDVYKTAKQIKVSGGKIIREAGPLPVLNTKITACLDPDGWKSVFVDNADFMKELG